MMFFFSSGSRHTRWPRDWNSDVCSSDLRELARAGLIGRHADRFQKVGRLARIGRASCRERVLVTGAVTGGKLTVGAVNATNLAAHSVGAAQLASNAEIVRASWRYTMERH